MSVTTLTEASFPFIVSNGPKVPKGARTTIRKQAMKDVGLARKKRGNYGRVNMRQCPLQQEDARGTAVTIVPIRPSVAKRAIHGSRASSTTWSSTTPDPTDLSMNMADVELILLEDDAGFPEPRGGIEKSIPPSLIPHPDYHQARSRSGIDLVDLSILTNFNIGKSTIAILSADPSRLASLLGEQQWSYLEFVPTRYGVTECLTAATNCLLAKVKQVLAPRRGSEALCAQLYGKALRSLQDAIADDKSALDADVLCATQLLSLHELLDASQDAAWSQHVHGSARLIRYRTVDRFKSEFEKALFAAHVGGIVSESLGNNTHCYLAQPEWVDLYNSLAQETRFLTIRHPLAIQIRIGMFHVPGLWHDIDEAVNSPDFPTSDALSGLVDWCRDAHSQLLDWLEEYKAHCVRLSFAQPPQMELALRRELFGTAMECLALVKRLLATVCEAERISLEFETQALAHLILDLQKQPSPKHSWLFSGQEVGVAYTVLLTKDQWDADLSMMSEVEKRLAARTRYNTWSNTLRGHDQLGTSAPAIPQKKKARARL